MPLAVKSRFLAFVATALIGVIAVALLRGRIGIDVAAMRALVLLVVVIVVDRLLMPWVQLAVGGPAKKHVETPAKDR
jgi:hypothetical protein